MLTQGGRVVVVGHGPSLKRAGLGKEIDSCDVVVRLKNCSMLLAEHADYGRKTDVMCSSTEVLTHLHKVKAKEYWGTPKKGTFNKASVWRLERQVGKDKVFIALEVSNLWNAFFVEMGGKHPNVSTGVAAAIIALDRLKPRELLLAGFDKVWSPETKGYQCTVPTVFNDDGRKDTGHDWKAERQLLPYLAAHYKTRIADFAGGNDISSAGIHQVWKAVPSDAS